jgi:hypothetical protein
MTEAADPKLGSFRTFNDFSPDRSKWTHAHSQTPSSSARSTARSAKLAQSNDKHIVQAKVHRFTTIGSRSV